MELLISVASNTLKTTPTRLKKLFLELAKTSGFGYSISPNNIFTLHTKAPFILRFAPTYSMLTLEKDDGRHIRKVQTWRDLTLSNLEEILKEALTEYGIKTPHF